MNPFLAQIIIFAGNFAPRGWAFCDGQLLSINDNQALFSLLGTTYGGDGRTTFALPDLRGRIPIHSGHSPGLSTYTLGQKGGSESVTQNHSLLAHHSHSKQASQATTTIGVSNESGEATTPDGNILAIHPHGDHYYTSGHADSFLGGTTTVVQAETVLPSGGNQPIPNIEPYLAVNYIIALQGVFPSRS